MSTFSQMKDLKAKHDKLDAAWKAKDLNTCKKLLQEIKVLLMTELQFLPTDVNIESQKVVRSNSLMDPCLRFDLSMNNRN